MAGTFAEYIEKWLTQATARGLSNPLVKMPIKRFRPLSEAEYAAVSVGETLNLGTMSDPISRNLYRNYQSRIRERGEHCAYVCSGVVEMHVSGAANQQPRAAVFPVCLKRAVLSTSGEKVKAKVYDDEKWRVNPVLQAQLLSQFGISIPPSLSDDPHLATRWIAAQLGNRATQVRDSSYVGLFSSQQMVVHDRLTEPALRRTLAHNPVVRARVGGGQVKGEDLGEITDAGIEELGLVLPCDDSQLRVIQLSDKGMSLQVEGPPGTGKSQTIANIISNALFHDRKVLLVCDKRSAIIQVEERLTNCGLGPALLNLHDEGLDKREFLRQATTRFPDDPRAHGKPRVKYPFDQLSDTRKALNERVKFGRSIAHPSLQVSKREALAGLIQLRKELGFVPSIPIKNWHSLSKDRFTKLLNGLGEWPGLKDIVADAKNIWNSVIPESFDENPNAVNEIQVIVKNMAQHIESLDDAREWAATVGVDLSMLSDKEIAEVLALVDVVLRKPACHHKVIGNPQISCRELERLNTAWLALDALVALRHPVPLQLAFSPIAESEAVELCAAEGVVSWQELSMKAERYASLQAELEHSHERYLRMCSQIGLVPSPLLKTRRAQLQAVLGLGEFGGIIPREWWSPATNPVLAVNGWVGKLRACGSVERHAPIPLNFIALERIAPKYWQHVEAMAEHGFNILSYCTNYVNDRRCKYALRQAYPGIPVRGFNQWRAVTLHAVDAMGSLKSLRSASEAHVILKQLTENYLSVAHESADGAITFLQHPDVKRLERASALVEQWRSRNDMFEVASVHWQTFWETTNQSTLLEANELLSGLDALTLPFASSDDIGQAIEHFGRARRRLEDFLHSYELQEGDRSQAVVAAFTAQKQFALNQARLEPLPRYLALQADGKATPDWQWLRDVIDWRDMFERLRGNQKLDVDSHLWQNLRVRLTEYQSAMGKAYEGLDCFFEEFSTSTNDIKALRSSLSEVVSEIPRHPRWLEKKRWANKLPAFPELLALWEKTTKGEVQPEQVERLFCFNLLRLCDPVARPMGPELEQTVSSFVEQDEKLASWILDHLKAVLRQSGEAAAANLGSSAAELRRLSGLQRIRGTVRELVNTHFDYLLMAKGCWMMSPTSLANLVDSRVFEDKSIFRKEEVPFDLVIFDEASQIRVMDGLLAMTFGKQVIIVGDRHQLPPTDFFTSFASPEVEPDPQEMGISESLLDEFSGVFADDQTHVMLMCHYRSETPDLIRFSNDWFYEGKLEMYPPAHVAGIGRRLHSVPNAVYSEKPGDRSNPIEAREVVGLIAKHMRECPEKSLGVVTMNISQMELIDQYLQEYPDGSAMRQFVDDESRFFIRNLETVQGDEMDRIILSLTYGRNPSGQFSAAFLGPLTKSGGERRLNVAITRSRSGLIVVSSMRSADLEASSAQSAGFRCLKELLAELEAGGTASSFGIGSARYEKRKNGVSNIVHCESPFEEQVVEFLENEGYEIECQYGAGQFRLDIVVKERSNNILVIECDGASYHSSLVARTRDRARQRILEKLGWRFHRVWSTNWWSAEDQEKESIIAAIESARKWHERTLSKR